MEKGYVMALGAKFLGFDRLDKYQMAINKDEAKIIVLIYDLYLHGCSFYVKYLLKFANFSTKKGLISNIYCIKPMLLMWYS